MRLSDDTRDKLAMQIMMELLPALERYGPEEEVQSETFIVARSFRLADAMICAAQSKVSDAEKIDALQKDNTTKYYHILSLLEQLNKLAPAAEPVSVKCGGEA